MNETKRVTPPEVSWWSLPRDEALLALEADEHGLTAAAAARRLERWGPNQLEDTQQRLWVPILISQFTSPLIYILMIAAAVTFVLQEWIDAGFIIAVVLFNAVIGFFQEYRAERSIEALRGLTVARAHVLRDGREQEVDARHLVPGDVVVVEGGVKVPADCRLLGAAALEVDESLLTGESTTVAKGSEPVPVETSLADRSNMLSMGTIVVRGRGRAMVVATGASTNLGQVAGLVEDIHRTEVPLVQRMSRFARLLGYVVLGGSILGFAAGVAAGGDANEVFLTLVALAVSAIPEGLPIVMTVTLAIGLNRMAKRNVIIRRLAAVEALGSCTAIGSDKTGTLTQNRMTVTSVYAGGRTFEVSGSGYEVEGGFQLDGLDIEAAEDTPLYWALLAGALCNEASLALDEEGGVAVTGDPTEIALLASAVKAGVWKAEAEIAYPRWSEIPFDAQRRYEATFHRSTAGPDPVFVKGAPEQVLTMCKEDVSGAPLDHEAVLDAARDMARRGLRVLAMAYSEEPHLPESLGDANTLRFAGLQGMIDPPREGVLEAVRGCQDAGIRVLMITGDHAETGLAIGRELGIAGPADHAMTGRELDGVPDADLLEVVRSVPVFARVSPEHKLRIVQALQRSGEVVAVTGDGVNDGPALKAANIGVAMGLTGTDVAKEASDVVVTDDNFASIFAGVREGRVVFDNVRMVTFYLISSGVGEVLVVLSSIFLGLELPLLPAQLLWMNVVTNGVQDVALAFEPGEEDVTKRRPRATSDGVISRVLWERTLLTGLTLAAGTLFLFWQEIENGSSIEQARTVALTTAVLFQCIHVGNSRSERRSAFAKSPLLNPFLLLGTGAALAAHIGAMYFGPMQDLLRIEPLDATTWAKMVGMACTVLVVNELHKLLRRPR